MSIEQARMAHLAISLAQIAAQQHKLSLEMATIQEMRRELAVKGSAHVLKMVHAAPSKRIDVSCVKASLSRRRTQVRRVSWA